MIENKFMKTENFYIKSITPGVCLSYRIHIRFDIPSDSSATDLDNDCQRQDKLTTKKKRSTFYTN